MPATGLTPTGPGTTGFQWWPTNWHYFVMPDSIEETLRSDGTTFTVVGDSNIVAGVLTNTDGSPKYPIVISLASEAIQDSEIAQLTNYVAAGGFLFVGSSAFTRNPDGTSRTNFALASAMGVNMVNPGLTNWGGDLTFTKLANHLLVSHFPAGTLFWQMPSSADEITVPQPDELTSLTPDETPPAVLPYLAWQVQANGAAVIAEGDLYPNLLVKQFGKGYFVYYSSLQPLIGHGAWAPSTYAYSIFRNAIEWAFQSDNLPVVKLSPWPYPYKAAVMFRHDCEAIPSLINSIESSAQAESTNGAKGEYYFCTGSLRKDYSPTLQTNEIASLQRAISLYGAVISSHNGGLTNISVYVPSLDIVENLFNSDPNWYTSVNPYGYDTSYFMPTDYSYWHWGPDEVLDATNLPPDYASGIAYALTSISNSLSDLGGWGLTNSSGLRIWASPNFNATREPSYQIEQQLGIKATGEEKLGPFPSWVLSTQTPDKRYPFITLPPSDWFVDSQIGQSMEQQTIATVPNIVDYYYNLGALLNLYGHSSSADNAGRAGPQYAEYVTYSMNASLHPRLWAANSVDLYSWWLQRSNAQITAATFTTNGSQSQVTINVSGAVSTNTAVEILTPSASFEINQVLTNGVQASSGIYWTNGQVIKLLVGTSVTNAVINYTITPSGQSVFYATQEGTLLSVAAPGVLTNATGGSGPLMAILASGPANGALTLNTDGSFTYAPSNNFVGIDSFNYQATDGSLTSSVATVTIDVTPPGDLFFDNFARSTNNLDPFFPWIYQDGTWTLTNSQLQGVGNGLPGYYGHVYIATNWTDYLVQGQIQFLSTNMWAGGIGGRLDPTTGAHYVAWVFPEGSQGPNYPPTIGATGVPVLKLMKFQVWQADNSQFTVMQQVNLPSVGTNVHTVALAFQGTNISVYFDNTLEISTNDSSSPFTSGGITLDAGSYPTPDTMVVDSVVVTTLPLVANNDSYSVAENTTLTVGAPGVLANDIGTGLTAALVSGPANGILTFNSDGSFAYTPTNNFLGVDSFTYQASNGQTNSNTATVSITVTQDSPEPVTATNDYYSVVENTTLNVAAPGVLTNDAGGSGPLTAILASGPANGALTLNTNGSFTYTPSNNFVGIDSFNYQATDGSLTSSVATVTIDVTPPGALFYDNFTRSLSSSNSLFPWIYQDGIWGITNDVLQGIGNSDPGFYGHVYIATNWTDYSIQAQIQFVSTTMFAGGIGGRLDPTTGAHYVAWVFPEESQGPNYPPTIGATGVPVLKLMKFQVWDASASQFTVMQQVNLPSVGTDVHTVALAFQGTNISVYFDNTLEISTNDSSSPFTSGGITLDAGSYPTPDIMGVDSVVVTTLPLVANNDSYSVAENTTLTVGAPGVLANDIGTGLTAALVSGPANGILTFNSDGSFAYTPTNNFLGVDSFTYQASNGQTNSNTATVSITVTPNPVVATNDYYSVVENTTLDVAAPGVLTNDAGGSGPLTAILASGPANGALTLNTNGSFTYTPSNNFVGIDSFNYQATDGSLTSSVATVTIDVTPPGALFYDNFTRSLSSSNSLFPWIYQDGIWGITNDVLQGIGNSDPGFYGHVYIATNWTDYSIQAQIQFVSTTMFAGGVGGRLDPTTGAHYVAWVFPEESQGPNYPPTIGATGVPVLKLMKFQVWQADNSQFTVMQQVNLPSVGTDVHTVALAFQGTNISVYFDNTLEISTNDSSSPFTSGGITLDAGSYPTPDIVNYDYVTVSSLLQQQTINFGPLSSKTYGDPPFTVSATASSGLTVSFSILSGPATISSNTITITGVGTVTVQASQAGNGSYQAAPNVDQSFVVSPKVLTVSANNTNRAYGATNPVFTVSYNGFVNGDTTSVLSGSPVLTTSAVTNSPVGSYVITNSIGNLVATNYAVSLTNGLLTINPAGLTLTASNQAKVYGQTLSFAGTEFGVSGLLNGDSVSSAALSSAGSAAVAAVAGSPYSIVITNAVGNGLTNYTISYVNGLLTVNPALLGVSANNTNRAYGATNPVFTVSYNGFVNGDTTSVLSGSPVLTTSAVTNSPVGSYVITNSIGNLVATNYAVSLTNGLLTIGPAGLTLTASNQAKVYGQTLSFAGTEFGVSGLLNGDSVSSAALSSAGSAAGAAVAGSPYSIVITNAVGNGLTNYTISYVNGLLTVNPALLGVSANNTNRAYGAANPVFTVSYNGFVNGDTTSVLSGSPVLTTSAVTNSPVGSYVITNSIGNLVATNYAVSLTNGLLTIGPAGLTLTASNQAKVYGQTLSFAGTEFGVSGLLNGDSVSSAALSSAGSAAGAAVAGSPYSIVITNAVGNGLTNYTISYVNGLLTVNPALLGVSANNTNRAYGAANPVFTVSYSGFVNGDGLNVLSGAPVLTTSAVTNSPVGSYTITNSVGTLVATNYAVSLTNGLLTIGPAGLTLTASNQAKVYGQTLSFAGTEFGVSGLLNGDSVSSAALSSAGSAAGAAVAGSPYSIVITNAVGNGLTNYTISYVNGLLTVNPALLGVSANNTNRAYGAANPVFTVSYSGFVNGDGLNVLSGAPVLTTSAVTNSPVGSYTITNSVGTLVATNYAVSLTNGLLTIGPAGLTLTASNQAKVYGQTLSFAGTEFGVSGLLNGDSVSSAALSSAGSAAGAAVAGSPYSIVITNAVGNGLTNYTISYVNGLLTVNPALLGVSANNTNRAYGAANPVFTVSYSGFVNGEGLNVLSGSPVLTTSAVTNSPVGSYTITNSVGTLVATNYAVSLTNGLLTIGPAGLTLTASNQAKVYGQTLSFAGTEFGVSGLLNGDSVSSAALSSAGSAAGAAVAGSPYSIVITNAVGNGLTNYTISYVNGLLTVNPALLGVSANNTNRAYGAANPVFTVSYSGFVNGDGLNVLSGAPVLTTSAVTNSPVGSYTITNSVGTLVATNYAVSLTNGLLTIGPAGLTLTASNQAKVYGQTLSFAGTEFGVSGLLNGDSVSSAALSSAGSAAGAAVAGSPYSIVITNAVGNGLTNYTISYVNGLLTVNPALLGVSANNTNRAYGAANPVFTVSYSGFVNGDTTSVLSGAPVLTTSAVTNSPVGSYTITNSVGTLVATNYAVSLTNGMLTINPALLGVSANNTNRAYGAANPVFTVSYSGFVNGDTTSVLSGSPVLTTSAVTNSPVGSYTITNSVGTLVATNYAVSLTNGLLTINPALLGVSANNTNRAYGAANPVFTVSYSGFVNGDTTSVLSGAPVLTTSAVTNSPVGSYTITNSVGTLVATNYAVSLTNGLLTINPALLGVSANNTNRAYGAANPVFTVSYSGFVNGDTTSVLSGSPVLTTSAVTNSPVGSYTITNSVGTLVATNYAVSLTNGLLTINPALLGVSANNTNRAYGAANPVFTVSYSGFVNGDTTSVLSGAPVLTTSAVTNSPVGSYTITNSVGTLVATNYAVSLTNGLLTINPALLGVSANNTNRAYGAANPVFTVSYSGFVNGDTTSVLSGSPVLTTSAVTNSPVGSYTITNSVGTLVATNYAVSLTNGLLTINPALLGVSANNTNRAYGAANPVFTVSYSGFVNGEGLNVLSGSPVLTTSAVTNSPVGSYVITNSVGTLVATNYAVSLTNGMLTINPALLGVSANNTNRAYGAANPVFTVSYSGFVNGDTTSVLSGSPVLTTSAVTNSPVGSYTITNSVGTLVATNYAVSLTNGMLTINPALLGVSANNTNRAYGAANPVFTVSYNGFVNGDTTSVLSGAPVLTTSAVTNSPVGSYTITNSVGTLVATNYAVSLTNGMLTINPALLGVSANNTNRAYGAANPVFTVSYSGFVNGDTTSVLSGSPVLTTSAVTNSPVGSYTITNSVGTLVATNYAVSLTNGMLTINPALLGVSANNTNRAYGAANPVFTVSYSGFVNGDTTSVLSGSPVLTTSAVTNSPVGSYTITNSVGTLVATNYAVSLTNGMLTINPALLGVSANNTNRAYGAANPVFTVSYNGFVNGDTTSVLSGAPVLTTSAVTNSPVGSYTITNSVGTLVATNYAVSLTNGLLTINPALLGVSANNTNRAYGAANPVFTVSYSGFVNGDTTSVLSGSPVLTTSAVTNSPVGSYTITNSVGTLVATNYAVSLTNGMLTINPALLGVSANNTNRAYGAANPVFTVSYSGFVNGDTTSVLSGAPVLTTSAVTNSPVGSYTITNSVGTLVATNYAVSLTNGLLTINPALLGVSANNTNRAYGAANPVFTVSYSGFVNGDTTSVLSGSPVLTTSAVTNSPVGSYTITNSVGTLVATNYAVSLTNGLLTINPALLGVSANNTNRAYGAANPVFTVSYSGFVNGEGLNVLSGSPVLTTSAVTNSPVGSYVITNSVGTLVATNYAVSLTNGMLTINPALLGVSANNTNRAYGAANPVFTVSYSGFVNGDTTSVLSGSPVLTTSAVTNSPVGSYTITNSVGTLVATNYAVSLTNGMLTINPALLGVSANNTNRAYGAANPVFTVSYNGFVNGDTTSVLSGAPVLTTSAVTNSPVGSYTITNSVGTLVATNYAVSLTNGMLTINPALLGVSANNTNRAYGAANPVFTVSYSGFVNGDTTSVLSGSPVLTTSAVTNSPVGSYTITNSVGTLVATNYAVSLTNGMLTINPALLGVSANNTNRAYGAANPVFTVSYSGFVNGDTTSVLSGAPVLTTSAVTNSPVGSYTITNSVGTLVATNYAVSLTNGMLTINPALLGVSANNTNRAYGAANPVFTVSYNGFVNGEGLNVLSGAPVLTTSAVTNSPVGSYTITNSVGTLVATNYAVSLTNGLLTINPALLGVSANNTNRAYGAANPVFTVSYSGFVNGDTTSVLSGSPVLTTSAVTNSPVGSYTITNSVGTLVATNYAVSLTNGMLTINPALLGVSANNTNRAYGAANPVFTVSYNGFVNGDTTSVLSGAPVLTTSAVTNSPVGSYTITNSVGTLVATNYAVSLTNGMLTINPALLGVSANNTNRAYGAANPVFTVSYSGFVNGDTTSVLSGSPVLTTSAVTNSPVGSYTITNSVGTLVATNYAVSLTNGLLTINPALLGVSANNTNRAYGAANPVFTVSYSGFVNGDTTSVLSGAPVLTTSAVTNSPVGSYTITNSVGTLVATNYAVSLTNGLLTINPALLGVSANNTNRAYGAANPVFTVSYSGFVNGEGLNVLSGAPVLTTSAVTNSPVGSYTITNSVGTLVATNYAVSLTNGLLTINPALLGVSANNTNRAYGAANPVFTVSYSGFVNGDTTSVLSGSPVLTTSAVTNSPVGSYTITNSVGTLVATNYAVSLTNGTLTVTGAVLTVAINAGITANNKVYDGTTAATITLSNVVLSGVVNGDSISLSANGYTANFASVNVGTGIGVTVSNLSLTGSSASNYTLIQPVALTANITAKALTIGSAAPPPVITSIRLTNGVVTITWNSVTGGIYRVQYINNLNGGGWTDLSPDVTATGSTATQTNAVGSAPQQFYRVELLNSGLSANNKVYDGTTTATINLNNVMLVGVVNGDSVSLVTNGYMANFANVGVGTNIPVSVSGLALSGASAGNYTLTQPTGLAANITSEGVTIASGISANNKVYDGTTAATISLTNVVLSGVVNGDSISLSANGYTANFASVNVGTGIGVTVSGLSLTGSSASNYTLIQPVALTANITAKALTIGSAVPPPVITSIRLTNGVVTITWNSVTGGIYRVQYINNLNGGGWTDLSPDVTATGSTATQTNAVGSAPQQFYRVELLNSGLSANNKVYDGTTTATINLNNVMLVGVVNGDSVSLVTNGYTANFASAAVGNDIPVSVIGLTLSGASAGNYTLTQPTGLMANITGKVLTILSVPPPVISSIRLTNGVVTITWNSVAGGLYRVQYITNLNSGVWTDLLPDVTATGSTASQTNTVGSAAQRFYRIEVLNSGITANNKVYDGTTVATINSNNVILVGLVGGDTVGLSTNGYTANFANPNVGTAIPVTVSGLALTGANAADYTLAPLVGLTASITPTTLTVSADNKSRTFGLPNPPLTVSYGGFVNSEGTNVLAGAPSLSTSATTNSPPGPYVITASIGTLSATNYLFSFVNGTLTVVALPQLSSVLLSGNQFALAWPTIIGQHYQLEYTTNLTAATWTLLPGPIAGTGNSIVVTNGLGVFPQQFFRLSISP